MNGSKIKYIQKNPKFISAVILSFIMVTGAFIFAFYVFFQEDQALITPDAIDPEVSTGIEISFQISSQRNIIQISCDADFKVANGIRSGSGIESDPFIISGWDINGNEEFTCISINHTRAHFILKECNLINGTKGIYMDNCSNFAIQNNNIEHIYGFDGDNGGLTESGADAGHAYGIQINNCSDFSIVGNEIKDVLGGIGGNGGFGLAGFNGYNGGTGGAANGMNIKLSNNGVISNNIIENVQGGSGGNGSDGSGPSGGVLIAGDGGNGGEGYSGTGMYLFSCNLLNITDNTISKIKSGNGGNGGDGADGSSIVAGGDGGHGHASNYAYGITIGFSIDINIKNNYIFEVSAGNGGNGGNGGSSSYSGFTSGDGSYGGYSRECFLMSLWISENFTVENNILVNTTGGNSGDGGMEGAATSGVIAGTPGDGSDGGNAIGLYVDKVHFNLVRFNLVKGVLNGKPGISLSTGENGEDGTNYAMYCFICENSEMYANDFCAPHSYFSPSVSGKFDNGTVGNYWGDYCNVCEDHFPCNGIADENFTLNSDSKLNDTHPLLYRYTEDINSDTDSLTNLQEYHIGSHPGLNDTDEDLIPDDWEYYHNLDPTYGFDSNRDPDFDGLITYQEYLLNTDPFKKDTDGDGFDDNDELNEGTDPTDAGSYPTLSFLEILDENSLWLFLGLLSISIAINIILFRRAKKNNQRLKRESGDISPVNNETLRAKGEIPKDSGKKKLQSKSDDSPDDSKTKTRKDEDGKGGKKKGKKQVKIQDKKENKKQGRTNEENLSIRSKNRYEITPKADKRSKKKSKSASKPIKMKKTIKHASDS